MTTERKIEVFLFFGVALLGTLFFASWLQEREARIRGEATQQANDKVIAADQAAIHSRDAAAALQVQALERQSAAVQTPQQAAQVILRYLPQPSASLGAPQAIQTAVPVVERSQLSPAVLASLPPAPSYGIFTDGQLKDQAKLDLACQAVRVGVDACEADKVELQNALATETVTARSWEAAAKGGTKLQRFTRILKYVGCAGAGAGIGALAGQRSPAIGASIGAGAGVTACSLF